MMSDRISIVISHRFSTVQSVQHVLVLDEGILVEQGSHADLLARNGLYAEMYQLQARNYQEAEQS
jgi:ATP-binding cassette, subfamily B, bacterial